MLFRDTPILFPLFKVLFKNKTFILMKIQETWWIVWSKIDNEKIGFVESFIEGIRNHTYDFIFITHKIYMFNLL